MEEPELLLAVFPRTVGIGKSCLLGARKWMRGPVKKNLSFSAQHGLERWICPLLVVWPWEGT